MEEKKSSVDYEIVGELEAGYWEPKSFPEYIELRRLSALIEAWKEQQSQERKLRKVIGYWLFILITFQIVAIFSIVFLDGFEIINVDATVVKIIIPGALAEVFGMGYLVVKYLFSPSVKDIYDILK